MFQFLYIYFFNLIIFYFFVVMGEKWYYSFDYLRKEIKFRIKSNEENMFQHEGKEDPSLIILKTKTNCYRTPRKF
jgi:hypothetical protein